MSESESDSSSDGVKLTKIYTDLYLCKQPTRTSIQSGMGWLPHASDDSTSEASFLMMDVFCNSVATSLLVV
jgi:hypothetical protein